MNEVDHDGSAEEAEKGRAGRYAILARLRQPDRGCRAPRGEAVLDLGSGGGIDVILSAKRVGPTGVAYELDMTDEMLERARNKAGLEAAGFEQISVEFTHQVADGMHGGIVKAVKIAEPVSLR